MHSVQGIKRKNKNKKIIKKKSLCDNSCFVARQKKLKKN
jgi:hypothetical protein